MISYSRTQSIEELQQILDLQMKNYPDVLNNEERQVEGFVTVQHTLKMLEILDQACPHIIAIKDNSVIGYALCMHPKFKNDIDVLKPMFLQIDKIVPSNLNYMVMGQICIAKHERGKGVFDGLYNFMASQLKHEFDAIITEVDFANARSMKAHLAYGFKSIKEFEADNHHWNIVIKYLN